MVMIVLTIMIVMLVLVVMSRITGIQHLRGSQAFTCITLFSLTRIPGWSGHSQHHFIAEPGLKPKASFLLIVPSASSATGGIVQKGFDGVCSKQQKILIPG